MGGRSCHLDSRGSRTLRLTVRESGPHEAETLLAIQQAASVAALAHIFPPERYPYPAGAVLDHWRSFPGRVLVAEEEDDALGLAAVDECWLLGLYVVPRAWGTGVGPRLHDDAVAALRDTRCSEVRLWVLEHNDRARRFYERRGWRLNEDVRVVPFPPNPIDVSYTLDLSAASDASWSATR